MKARPLVLVLAIVASGPVVAQAAGPVATTVSASDVAVTLAASRGVLDERAGVLRDVRGLAVQIARAGAITRPAAALTACRHFCGPSPGAAGVAGARIADLDGDGEPEVLVDRSDGFNVCCTEETALLARDASTGAYGELDVRFGSGYRVIGGPLVRGDDVRFYTRYEPRVIGVYLPVRIWRLRAGVVRDVTRSHPLEVRRDLTGFERVVDANARGPRTDVKRRVLRSALPAWAADNELLGRRAMVARRLRELTAAHRITPGYGRSVRRLLVRLGYRR